MNRITIIPQPNQIKTETSQISWNTISNCICSVEDWYQSISQFLSQIEKIFPNSPSIPIEATPNHKNNILEITQDFSLKLDEYSLTIFPETDDPIRIQIKAHTKEGLLYALISMIQLMDQNETDIFLPCCSIQDSPYAEYRGVLIDIARKPHKIPTLKQIILLCQWYKIKYLHIHFTDNQSFTLPSAQFPQLKSRGRSFSKKEIQELVRFAETHNVCIIPEIDIPGHSRTLIEKVPKIFKIPGKKFPKVIHTAKEEVYQAIENMVGELCDLFPNTPIIHLGADEASFKGMEEIPEIAQFMKHHQLESEQELYRYFITRLHDIVAKVSEGNKMLGIWEGFHHEGKIAIPKDLLVYEFECEYNTPDQLLADGYTLINTSWKPIYVTRRKNWDVEAIYHWNIYRWENWTDRSPATKNPYQFQPEEFRTQIKGAQICSWEQKDKDQLPSLRQRVAALAERTWNTDLAENIQNLGIESLFQDFQERLQKLDDYFDSFKGTLS